MLFRSYLDVEYSGIKANAKFTIIDSGKIVIPSWIKNLGKWWFEGLVTDSDFARGIEYLIQEKIIIIPESESQTTKQETKIPSWVKNNAGWWSEGLISDSDFALGIQHLIKIGIITV